MPALTNESEQLCECCEEFTICRMYVVQGGWAAWICRLCRGGEFD